MQNAEWRGRLDEEKKVIPAGSGGAELFTVILNASFVILNAVKNLKLLRFAQDDTYKYVIT